MLVVGIPLWSVICGTNQYPPPFPRAPLQPPITHTQTLTSVLVDCDGAGVSQNLQVPDDPLELSGGHADGGLVFGVRDAEVVSVNVHELELEVAHAVVLLTLEHEGKAVGRVLGLEGDDVGVVGAFEDLAEVAAVESKTDVPVATEVVEAITAEGNGAKGDVGAVHSLDGKSLLGAVNVGIEDEILSWEGGGERGGGGGGGEREN